ncbi:MAG: twin-arginine translocase subunit TatC, partial [bacterium]
MSEPNEKEKKITEKEMPFLEHLEELRWRLLKAILAVVVCSVGVYFFADKVLAILVGPYNEAVSNTGKSSATQLIFLSPTGGFMIYIKLSVFSGIMISIPIIFYQMWLFIAPGLFGKEKKYVPLVVFFSTL